MIYKIKKKILKNKFIKLINSISIKNKHPLPLYLNHIISYKCNGNCDFCYLKKRKLESESNIHEIKKFLKKLGYLRQIQINGGETFLYPHLKKLVSYYIKYNECNKFIFITNGSLSKQINEFFNWFYSKYKHKKIYIMFSIDDFPKKHDKSRKIPNLSFLIEKTIKNLKKEKYPNLKIGCNICINESNYKRINEITKHIHRIKEFDLITHTLQRFEKKNIITNINLNNLIKNSKTYLEYLRLQMIKKYLNKKLNLNCVAGKLSMTLLPDGDLRPCEIYNNNLVNINKIRLNSSKEFSKFQKKKFKLIKEIKKCSCSLECQLDINLYHNFNGLLNAKLNQIKFKFLKK